MSVSTILSAKVEIIEQLVFDINSDLIAKDFIQNYRYLDNRLRSNCNNLNKAITKLLFRVSAKKRGGIYIQFHLS